MRHSPRESPLNRDTPSISHLKVEIPFVLWRTAFDREHHKLPFALCVVKQMGHISSIAKGDFTVDRWTDQLLLSGL